MTHVGVAEANTQLSKYLNRAAFGRERIIVTSHGTPKAAIIGLDDLEKLERLEKKQEVRTAKTS